MNGLESCAMRASQQIVIAVGLLVLAVAVTGAAMGASEEGPTEESNEITLECRPATVIKKTTADSMVFTHPNCFCDDAPEPLRQWLVSLVDGWRSGQPLPPAAGGQVLLGSLAPGEQAEITLYCLSPEQVAAYRDAVLAQEEGTPGEG